MAVSAVRCLMGTALVLALTSMVPKCAQAERQFYPGQEANRFSVPTLGGVFTFQPGDAAQAIDPVLVLAYDASNAASRYMWTCDQSLRDFLTATPDETQYLFATHTSPAAEHAQMMHDRMEAALQRLPPALRQKRRRHMHFATQPIPEMANWLPALLRQWRSPRKILVAETLPGNWQLGVGRLDGQFGFVPSPEGLIRVPIVAVRDVCHLHDTVSTLVRTAPGSIVVDGISGDRSARDPSTDQLGPAASGPSGFQDLLNLKGKAALVLPTHAGHIGCSYTKVLQRLQEAGASVAIIGSYAGKDVTEIACKGKECEVELTIPAAMIPFEEAVKINASLHWPFGGRPAVPVVASFATQQVDGHFAAIDSQGLLAQVGWEMFPTLMHEAWEAQWLSYTAELHANLSRPALVVPVFHNQTLPPAESGLQADVRLPPAKELAQHMKLELDFALSCRGHLDADCPVWDHVVQLFVCCEDPGQRRPPCKACSPTVWQPAPVGGRLGASGWSHADLCGPEIGRWVTPFRRRVGRWLTDVSMLMPLLEPGGQCRFTLQAPAWAPDWKPTLNLRFSPPTPPSQSAAMAALNDIDAPAAARTPAAAASSFRSLPAAQHLAHAANQLMLRVLQKVQRLPAAVWRQLAAAQLHCAQRQQQQQQQQQQATLHEAIDDTRLQSLEPFAVLPLFEGGTFGADYNRGRQTMEFLLPPGTAAVLLEAVITGHGYDTQNFQCAEFCPTSHHFVINSIEHAVSYLEAGAQWGCAHKVRQGSVPNEHGTWQYGRMGWCDGQEVRPWVVDVTASALQAGGSGNMTVSYHGWFEGKDPEPTRTPGYVMMESNLVFLRRRRQDSMQQSPSEHDGVAQGYTIADV